MATKKYRKKESSLSTVGKFLIAFSYIPWYLNVMLAVGILTLDRWYNMDNIYNNMPLMFNTLQINKENFVEYSIYIISGLFLMFSILGFHRNYKRRNALIKNLTLKKLVAMDWMELEELVKNLFQASGYKVKERGGAQADGGVDLEVYRNGRKIIVQCKQYKSSKISVSIVREMYGVMMHEKASRVYIFTCGEYTSEALKFAYKKPIILIDGRKLVEHVNLKRI